MERGLSKFIQVTLVLLAPCFTLYAQRGGQPGLMSQGNIGGASRAGLISQGDVGRALHTGASGPISAIPQIQHFTPPSTFQMERSGPWPARTPGPLGDSRPGVGYRRHYPTVYAGYPWLVPYAYSGFPLAYGAPYGDDSQEEPVPQQQAGYDVQPPGDYIPEAPGRDIAANAPSPFRPPYEATGEIAPAHAQPATTLIFMDGRKPIQVHNYAITGSTLYALDDEFHQEIPLSDLNVPATIEANRKTGVEFALPAAQ